MQRNANNASHWSAESALEPVSELRGRKYFRSVANWSNLFSLLINKYLSSEYYKQWSPRDTAIGRNSNLNAFCVCVCSVMQSCLTVCDPMVCGPPDSSVYGIFQARILEWVAISYSRGSSPPRDQTHVSCPSCFGSCCLVTQLSQLFCESLDWGLPGKNAEVDCHFFSPGDLPDPGIKPESPALQVDSLPLSHRERHWALWLLFNYSIIDYIYIYHSTVPEGIQISRLDYKNISEIFFFLVLLLSILF